MQFIMTIFGWPLGFVMLGCYMLTGNNYALAITVFTVITKIALLPLSIKQQKEQAKMAVFQPKLQNIQKKYGNNKERYNEEIQKLYTEEGYNPMSGCLPSLIQFPILFGVIDVVYKPIYHIFRASNAVIDEMVAIAETAGHVFEKNSYYTQINLLKIVKEDPEIFSAVDAELIQKILDFDMTLFGLDLGVVPQFALTYEGAFNWYLLIPILCGVFQLGMTFFMQKSNPNSQQGGAAMNIMLYMMPLMSVYIGFIVPAAAGFYWTLSAVAQLVQSVAFHFFLNQKKLAAKVEAEVEAEKEAKRAKRQEAKEKLKELQKEKAAKYADKDAEASSDNKKKLAEARKRAAEKYGERYDENDDLE